MYHDVIDILLLHISGCIDPPGTGIYLSTQYMGGGPKKMPLMRIPYTSPLPDPTILPTSARSLPGAIASLYDFLAIRGGKPTVLLTGAGISVASGLADYRGTKGTYTLNKTYRPIYYHEFVASHEARKRYWARSYLGWTNLSKSQPNPAHHAVADLARMGYVSSVITQSMLVRKLARIDCGPLTTPLQTLTRSTHRHTLTYVHSNCTATCEVQCAYLVELNTTAQSSRMISLRSTLPGRLSWPK